MNGWYLSDSRSLILGILDASHHEVDQRTTSLSIILSLSRELHKKGKHQSPVAAHF